jgi:hypothetical protein
MKVRAAQFPSTWPWSGCYMASVVSSVGKTSAAIPIPNRQAVLLPAIRSLSSEQGSGRSQSSGSVFLPVFIRTASCILAVRQAMD